ncbi:MAG: 3'-5' exonuclease [Lautropia sp.]|nr:3'-5' exonuclease [Lautropia sp.]
MSRQIAWLLRTPPSPSTVPDIEPRVEAAQPEGATARGAGEVRRALPVFPDRGSADDVVVRAARTPTGANASTGGIGRMPAARAAGTVAEAAGKAVEPAGSTRKAARAGARPLPSREEVLALPPFDTLSDEAIIMVDPAHAEEAGAEIREAGVVGFDTESKPVFVRGQTQDGPHLVQFAVADRAWLFSLMEPRCIEVVGELLAQPSLWKVGFGLAGDRIQLNRRFGRMPVSLIDLDVVYRRMGYRTSTGIRMAMAVTFGRRFEKSKAIGKSDWSDQPLTQAQRRYAAHDAWGAFRIHQELLAQGVDVRP